MYNTGLAKRAAILSRIPRHPLKTFRAPKQDSNNQEELRSSPPGFAPVKITDLPEKESTEGLQCIGQSSSEYYAYIPGKLVVIKIIRPKYLN